jgi:hypothetical protein
MGKQLKRIIAVQRNLKHVLASKRGRSTIGDQEILFLEQPISDIYPPIAVTITCVSKNSDDF